MYRSFPIFCWSIRNRRQLLLAISSPNCWWTFHFGTSYPIFNNLVLVNTAELYQLYPSLIGVTYMCRGQNMVCFLIEGDGLLPSVGFNKPIVMIPNIGWMTIAPIPCFDDGTYIIYILYIRRHFVYFQCFPCLVPYFVEIVTQWL